MPAFKEPPMTIQMGTSLRIVLLDQIGGRSSFFGIVE